MRPKKRMLGEGNRFKTDWPKEHAVSSLALVPDFQETAKVGAGQRLAKATKSSNHVSDYPTSKVSPPPEVLSSELLSGSTEIVELNYPSPESTSGVSVASLSLKLHEVDSSAATMSIISSDHRLMKPPTMTVCSAMYTNGRILGLTCACALASKSRPQPPEIPHSLQPLPIQLDQVHFQFIDRFPLPRLRERMIILADDFSSEEFVADLFGMPTFKIAPGAQPWDTEAWPAEPEFIEKWGFLLE